MSNHSTSRLRRRLAPGWAIGGLALLLAACASSSITQTGGLSSYQRMTDVRTARTKARISADPSALAAARTVRIDPVVYAPGAADRVSPAQSALVANLVARTLCVRLSDRFDIAAAGSRADLEVRAIVTRLTPTNREAAAVSAPLRVAGMVVGVPVPGRIPLGMGSFAAEGEAVDRHGGQRAAMVWARGADMFTNRPRASKIGDAYELSSAFGGDLAALIATGRNPLHEIPRDPFAKRKRPIPAACGVYGKGHPRETFMSGFIAGPPEWTDSKPPAAK
jgi:hypothetical protein